MTKVKHLYNSAGNWIAFKKGKYLYNTECKWIGWFPWDETIAVTVGGKYLGTVYKENRLLKNRFQRYLGYPGYPGYPGHPGYPGYPGYKGYIGYISGTEDVEKSILDGEE